MNTSPSEPENEPSRIRNISIGLIISCATLFLCAATVELAGYIWEQDTAKKPLGWTLIASRRMPLVRQGAEDQPYYTLEPNQDYILPPNTSTYSVHHTILFGY